MTSNAMTQNGAMFANGSRNEFYGCLFDTYQLTQNVQAAQTITLFDTPKGGTKGLELTNMTDSKKLNAGNEIDVDRIRVQFIGTNFADVTAFLQKYTMTITYGGKLCFEVPLDSIPGAGGVTISGYAATTVAATTINIATANNGPLHPDAGFRLHAPHLLYFTAGPAIEVNWICQGTPPTAVATASGGTNVFARVYLDGLRRSLN